jgi:hypothetical protein
MPNLGRPRQYGTSRLQISTHKTETKLKSFAKVWNEEAYYILRNGTERNENRRLGHSPNVTNLY